MLARLWNSGLRLPLVLMGVVVSLAGLRPLAAHPTESTFRLDLPVGQVHGTVLIPHVDRRIPCVVLIGGSLSHDRNGRNSTAGAPPRDALQRLAEALQAGGYGSIRYDRIGYGQSRPGPKWQGTYANEAAVAAAVIEQARKSRDFSQVLVAGESAGAYVACLAAKSGTVADGYLLLGALCGPAESLYAYNFGRLAEFAASSPERLAWAESKARYPLALGRHYKSMLAAAAAGQDEYRADDQGFSLVVGGLARRREELADPPDELFRVLKAPVLALAGAADRNVPPDHAGRIVAILREAGNEQATSRVIEGVDHSFQRAAASEDEQVRERFELTSFRRPYESKAYHALLDWLYEHFPTPAEGYPERVEQVAARPSAVESPTADAAGSTGKPAAVRAADGPETDAKTADTPERLHLAPGIQIVGDIGDAEKTAGVATLEGRIGPLLMGDGCQAHFIDMPGGMFVGEHPHSTESLIFTVRGKWVLCSAGRRHLMQPGTLFRFGPGTPTGYEVPFAEPALILIFKGDRLSKSEAEFMEYLRGMAGRLEKEHAAGTPFLLKELAADHPARTFARRVNPEFDRGEAQADARP